MSIQDLEYAYYKNLVGGSGSINDLLQQVFSNTSGVPDNRRFKAGGWYYQDITGSNIATVPLTLNDLNVFPFPVGKATRFDRVACSVETAGAAGSRVRLGIYGSTDGVPSNLVTGSAQLISDTLGVKEHAFDLTLQPGLYWLGIVGQANITTLALRGFGANAPNNYVGLSAADQSGAFNGYIMPGVSGALPSPFTHAFTANYSGAAPRICVRAA
jgi:hypothetical protein